MVFNMSKMKKNNKVGNELTCAWIIGLVLGVVIYAVTKDILYVSLGLTLGLFIGFVKIMFTAKKKDNTEEEYVRQLHEALKTDDSLIIG